MNKDGKEPLSLYTVHRPLKGRSVYTILRPDARERWAGSDFQNKGEGPDLEFPKGSGCFCSSERFQDKLRTTIATSRLWQELGVGGREPQCHLLVPATPAGFPRDC